MLWDSPILGRLIRIIIPIFFALSGFLVSASMMRAGSLFKFAMLRFLRVFPALTVEVILSALILGPLVTELPLKEYFSGKSFFMYFTNMFGWMHYELPGVFLHQPVSGVVNGSLWTVPFELACYAFLMLLTLTSTLRTKRRMLVALGIATVAAAIANHLLRTPGISAGYIHGRVLMLCFLGGSAIYTARDCLLFSFRWFVAALAGSAVCIFHAKLIYLSPLFIAYVTVYLGLQRPRKIPLLMNGDYSYGIYLYAAPIQQAIVWYLKDRNSWPLNIILALCITYPLAMVSWHFLEKPALRLKRLFVRRPLPDPKLEVYPGMDEGRRRENAANNSSSQASSVA